MIQVCPPPAELAEIPAGTCAMQFDQIVRIFFQRRGAPTAFTSTTIKTQSAWNTAIAASTADKVVLSPIFAELVIPQSEALTVGGNDNTTFNGIPDYNGEGMVTVTAQLHNLESAVKKAMKNLTPESIASSVGLTNLTAFFINREGYIIHNNFKGFPIYNFRVSSIGSEGFNAKNKNQLGFVLPPHWDDNAEMINPDFDPLTLTA